MSPNFEHFLHRARRNWTAWSIAEHAGLGLLAGCCCVLLLLPILLWREESGVTVAMVFPILGAVSGAIVGFRRRPQLALVAQIADARFNTADLLATALVLRGSNDPWHANILKIADACAFGLSPAALTPHRLGPRAWSGILLSLVAAITLGLLSVTMPPNRAQAIAAPAASPSWSDWEQSAEHTPLSIAQQASASREARAETTPDSQAIQDGDAMSQGQQRAGQSAHSTREGQAETGAGGGSARTDSAQAVMPTDHPGALRSDSSANGAIASGGQGAEARGRSDGGTTAGRVSGEQGATATPPWSGAGWPAAQAAAINAIDAGHVPDAYRNLVRDYFDRSNQADGSSHQ